MFICLCARKEKVGKKDKGITSDPLSKFKAKVQKKKKIRIETKTKAVYFFYQLLL